METSLPIREVDFCPYPSNSGIAYDLTHNLQSGTISHRESLYLRASTLKPYKRHLIFRSHLSSNGNFCTVTSFSGSMVITFQGKY